MRKQHSILKCVSYLCFCFIFLAGCKTKQATELPTDSPKEVSTEENDVTVTTTDTPTGIPDPYVTETPGVPDELLNSSFDLTTTLTVPALKDTYHNNFSVGVAINGSSPSTSSLASKELSAITKYHFNSVTYSNLMKASSLLDKAGCLALEQAGLGYEAAVNFASCIDGLEFCKENNIGMRGHVLVWHTQAPEWFFHEGYDETKPLATKELMLKRMENYIKSVLEFTQTEYPGVIYAWDVVNECVSTGYNTFDPNTSWFCRTTYDDNKDNLWYKVIGPEYVEKAYEYARKYADPDVKLFYNDYGTYDLHKLKAIKKLIKMLQEKDLIDGVGLQTNIDLTNPKMFYGDSCMRDSLIEYGELGVEIHLSEVSIDCSGDADQEAQAKRYSDLFDLIMEMDSDNGGPANITNVTFFGLMDCYYLYPNNNQYHWLFDKALQPKPAFYSVLEGLERFLEK